jgi:hypothetical protein
LERGEETEDVGATIEYAETLAKYERLAPGTVGFSDYVQAAAA